MESLGNSAKNESVQKYLNLSTMPEFKPFECLAYVHDVSLGVSKFDSGFIRFFVKDCKANITTATLFDVENFLLSGIDAMAFKHKAVKLTAVAQEYRGRKTLIIDGVKGITLYDGEFDYSKFVGRVDYDLTGVESMVERTGISLDTGEWLAEPIDTLMKGRNGGYCRLIEVVGGILQSVAGGMSDKDVKELETAFMVVANYYYRYLKRFQHLEGIGELGVYSLVNQLNAQYNGDDSVTVYIDALLAVTGAAKPRHLIAHVISNAFTMAKQTLELTVAFETVPMGMKCYVGGVELSKY